MALLQTHARQGGDRRGDREQNRSKVGVWGNSAKEAKEAERAKEQGDRAPREEKPREEKPKRSDEGSWKEAPAKNKKKAPVNAFDALNIDDDEEEN